MLMHVKNTFFEIHSNSYYLKDRINAFFRNFFYFSKSHSFFNNFSIFDSSFDRIEKRKVLLLKRDLLFRSKYPAILKADSAAHDVAITIFVFSTMVVSLGKTFS